jgi:hypothetical protein
LRKFFTGKQILVISKTTKINKLVKTEQTVQMSHITKSLHLL